MEISIPNTEDSRFKHLTRMFITYFNSEWSYENNLNTDYKLLIKKYQDNSDRETIQQTIEELEFLVECFHWGELELKRILIEDFCCAVPPKAYGLTYKEFVLEILTEMKVPDDFDTPLPENILNTFEERNNS